MTDFASLALKIDSSEVKPGVDALDKLTVAGAKAEKAADGLSKANVNATAVAGRTRMGMQQLGFQLNDVATGFASGTKASTIFAQQSGQVIQAIQLMAGGTSKFAAFMGGPWGIALTAATIVLVPFIGRLLETKDAMDSLAQASTDALEAWHKSIDTTGASSKAATAVTKEMLSSMGEVARIQREIDDTQRNSPGLNGRIAWLKSQKEAAQAQVDADRQTLDGIRQTNALLEMQAQKNEAAAKAVRDHTSAMQQFGREIDAQQARAIAQGAGFHVTSGVRTLAEQQWLYDNKRTAANPVALPNANAPHVAGYALDIGFGPGVTIEAIKKAYDEAGVHLTKVLTETGHYHIEWANKTGEAIARAHEAAAKRAADAYKKAADEAARSWNEALLGLYTQSADLGKRMMADLAASTTEDLAVMNADFAKAQQARIQGALDEAEARAKVNAQLEQTINYLDKIGGIGGGLGNIGAIVRGFAPGVNNGDFSGVNGTVGGILGLLSSTDQGKALVSKLGDRLDQTFGGNGMFAQTMTNVLRSAGAGSVIGGAVGGGSQGSQIGGALGGASGAAAGTLVSSAVLGAVLPGIGAIIGGLLGGLFGHKDPEGSVLLTGAGGKAVAGRTVSADDNGQALSEAQKAADAVMQTLNAISGAFGGTVTDKLKVTIGSFNGKWAINPTGQQYMRAGDPGVQTYASEADAVKAAIQEAVKSGAIDGLSDAVKTLLTAPGSDITAQLDKAQKFQTVMDSVAQATDPAKVALDALATSMTELTGIFQEANASADQMAALATYQQTQKDAILAKAAQDAYDKARPRRTLEIQIMQLEGKSAEALAAARQLELDGMDAALRPLQERINLLTDEAAATAKVAKVTAANDNLSQQLLDLQGGPVAKAAKRMAELAAITDASTRALQMQVYVQQDINDARAVLTTSYQRERGVLVGLSNDMRSFASSLYGLRQSLYANDNASNIGSVTNALASRDSGAASSAVNAYLASAKDSARTLVDYQRQVGKVAGLLDNAINGANGQASAYDAQIAALDKSVAGLVDVNDSVITVHDALASLNALLVPPTVEMANAQADANKAAADFQAELVAQVQAMRDENTSQAVRMIELTSAMATFWKRVETEGIAIASSNTDPVITKVAA